MGGESMYPFPERNGFYSSPTPPLFYKSCAIKCSAGWNVVRVYWPVYQALSKNPRNAVVPIAVYRQYAISSSVIVFDV